jgi:hypothetical protein
MNTIESKLNKIQELSEKHNIDHFTGYEDWDENVPRNYVEAWEDDFHSFCFELIEEAQKINLIGVKDETL